MTAVGLVSRAQRGRAPSDRRGAGSHKPRGAGPRATTEGMGPGRRPWGWAPEAEWGRAPCGRREAGLEKPRGAGPCEKQRGAGLRATAVGLGPTSQEG